MSQRRHLPETDPFQPDLFTSASLDAPSTRSGQRGPAAGSEQQAPATEPVGSAGSAGSAGPAGSGSHEGAAPRGTTSRPSAPGAATPSAAPFVPSGADLDALRESARSCRGCELYRDTTQTVFGQGPAGARIVMVGEQPGDIEDRRGAPFVGPAGKLLDRAIEEAGLDRSLIYVTNAVKHFKHKPAAPGKRRIHQTPDRTDIVACRPWLVAEFAALRPQAVVALGATAEKALLGPDFRVTRSRGTMLSWPGSAYQREDFAGQVRDGAFVLATIHPSAVLRADNRDIAYAGLVQDLAVVARALAG